MELEPFEDVMALVIGVKSDLTPARFPLHSTVEQ